MCSLWRVHLWLVGRVGLWANKITSKHKDIGSHRYCIYRLCMLFHYTLHITKCTHIASTQERSPIKKHLTH